MGAAICRIPALVQRAQRLGFRALALTDSGNLYATLEFALQAHAAGIQPIIGCEVEVAQASKALRRASFGKLPVADRLVLLATNRVGYRNLVWLVSQSHLQSKGGMPCVRAEWLTEHGNGLIALGGGNCSSLTRAVEADDPRAAEESVAFHVAAFGLDNFFIQIERGGPAGKRQSEARLLALARKHRIAVVATSDVRYLEKRDQPAFECLRSMRAETTEAAALESDLMAGASPLLSPNEMARLFDDLPEAIENTIQVAARCELDLVEAARDSWCGIAPEIARDAALTKMVAKGLRCVYRIPVGVSPDGGRLEAPKATEAEVVTSPATSASASVIVDRANAELDAVQSAGFSRWLTALGQLGHGLRRRNIPCILRDPGNGSLLAYALGLSAIDPLRHGLAWEPWLASLVGGNPSAGIEVPSDQRESAIATLRKTLSPHRVGGVITFCHLDASTLREHLVHQGEMSKPGFPHFWDALRRGMILDRFEHAGWNGFERKALAYLRANRPAGEWQQFTPWIRIAWLLNHLPWKPDEQLATFLVGTRPLIAMVPLARGRTGETTVQFGLPEVDTLDFLKVHLLDWEPLRILREVVEAVRTSENPTFTPDSIPPDDEEVITAILRNRPATKTSLLEPRERQLALRLGTRNLADLALAYVLDSPFANALIARRQGLEAPEPPHPLLADIVHDTYGLLLFQEQAIQAIQRLTGWSAMEATHWRRGTTQSRSGPSSQTAFATACWKQHRLPKATASSLFCQMHFIRRWKGNVVGKSQLLYWLTWLRIHHPQAYRAAITPRVKPRSGSSGNE